jgi:hypothetical protein
MGRPVVHWEFWSEDPQRDAYRKQVKQAGGKIIVERQDVPGVGQFSLFEDPESRVLGMWQQQK